MDTKITVESYAEDYSFEADEGSITPTENERAMLIDFGHGLLFEIEEEGKPALAAIRSIVQSMEAETPDISDETMVGIKMGLLRLMAS
jgi:hypothetical protein